MTSNSNMKDPDFNNALCNLSEITDLPERATLKIIPFVTFELTSLSSPTKESDCSTVDTEILSPAESPSLRRQWPEFFDIPNFLVDVEYRLRQADLSFMKDHLPITPSRDMKHDILEKLAETMYSFKAYPDDDDFSSVAKSLISKHPSLTEPGLQPGWYGWKNSLKFKMANYRTKLRKAGCDDVMINGGREIVTQEPAVQSMVKRWPGLFTERQVFAEFNRVASKNLEGQFNEALDQHTPRFIELFKSKKGTTGQKLTDLMQHINVVVRILLFLQI
ncbi:hypothetical protein L3Q82_010081 [Scortum barcoo]|uniref:Uncharacterized protein n=1 Tax=Scortum barcoo TaxID=214431 RepID=A0ACB8WAJ3_9TELE|nr:hypothetical protein L3Q82_010081 [Scortum barcoo]